MTADAFWSQAGDVCWKTPDHIIEATREAFGGPIDLDPCAGRGTSIGTVNFRLPSHDGLRESWDVCGNGTTVWVNHPFGTSWVYGSEVLSVKQLNKLKTEDPYRAEIYRRQTSLDWARKVVKEVQMGCEVVWISKAAMGAKALCDVLLPAASAVCHPRGRVAYVRGDGIVPAPTFESVVIYLGRRHLVGFEKAFAKIGSVWIPYDWYRAVSDNK